MRVEIDGEQWIPAPPSGVFPLVARIRYLCEQNLDGERYMGSEMAEVILDMIKEVSD